MNLHYTVAGIGDTVVFLHGMAGSSRYWGTLIDSMPRTKFRVICIDLLGFGLSPKPETIDYGYDAHLAAVTDVLEQLGVQEFTLVGHSMGALLALRLASMKTTYRIKKLVLISLPYYASPVEAKAAITRNSWVWRSVLYGKSSQVLCNLWCRRFRPLTKHIAPLYLRGLPKEAAQDSLLHTWHSYEGSLRNVIEQQNVKHNLETVTVPTIAICGLADQAYPAFKALVEVSSATCKLTVVPGAGHHVPVSHPQSIAPLLS